MTASRILVVDDEADIRGLLKEILSEEGYEVEVAADAAQARSSRVAQVPDLVLLDIWMPDTDGITLLREWSVTDGYDCPVVMMSGQASIEMAVKATRLGASDFLEKPISTDKLLLTVENVLRLKHLEEENRDLKKRLGRHHIVWASPAMKEVMAQVEQVAASETRVCIRGETGTGKELVARTLHEKSPRRAGPFISLNCAAVPSELMETELFGHEKGSFTGAASRHTGKFEQAHHGTLFLDEIGDMPMTMQAKLLRVLEEGEIERVGGDKPFTVDVRVVVATHRNLEEQVRQGTFREDLYHRVFVFPIVLPPLRERREDIRVLAEHFIKQLDEQNHWKSRRLSPEAIAELERYPWPGNVRELRNVVERVLLFETKDEIQAATVQRALPQTAVSAGAGNSAQLDGALASGILSQRVEAFERETLLAVLKQNHHHMTNTAKALGLERSHLYKKCQQLGIDLRALRHAE